MFLIKCPKCSNKMKLGLGNKASCKYCGYTINVHDFGLYVANYILGGITVLLFAHAIEPKVRILLHVSPFWSQILMYIGVFIVCIVIDRCVAVYCIKHKQPESR